MLDFLTGDKKDPGFLSPGLVFVGYLTTTLSAR